MFFFPTQDAQLIKLQQYLTKQYRMRRQAVTNKPQVDRSSPQQKLCSSIPSGRLVDRSPNSHQRKTSTRQTSSAGTTKQYSHRMDHYKSKPVSLRNEPKEEKLANTNPTHSVEHQAQVKAHADDTGGSGEAPLHQPDIIVDHRRHLLHGLNKMSRRHEHSSKVRQAQHAAHIIQKAWRQHQSQKQR